MQRETSRAPTIIDVARLAGVSKTTVARVISGAPNVSKEGRERVHKAIQASGYEQNRFALGLRTGKSLTLGLLIPDMSNTYWADVARGSQDEAEAHGYDLVISNSDWDAERERRHLQTMRRNRVDGVIVNPMDEKLAALRGLGAPVVTLGSSGAGVRDLSCVRNDVEQGVRLALGHLTENGHSNIGFIIGRRRRKAATRLLATARKFCAGAGAGLQLRLEEGDYTVESGYGACSRLLKLGRRGPTAIFAANDMMALGAIQAIREAGLSCPHDVSVIGMDGIPAGAFSYPGLTTVSKSRYEKGRRAAAHVIALLDGEPGPLRSVLPCTLVARGSVAALRPLGRTSRSSASPIALTSNRESRT